jgi:high-affinity iron transporter
VAWAAALGVLAIPVADASAQQPDTDRARAAADPTAGQPADAAEAGAVVSMLDLAHHEYAEAVRDGEVVNEAEYREARTFTLRAGGLFEGLRPDRAGAEPRAPRADAGGAGEGVAASNADASAVGRRERADRVAARLDSLAAVVERKGEPARYRELADAVAADLEEGWGAVAVPEPEREPSADRGAELYAMACAVCHGAGGAGDGRAADGMDPPPPDLTSPERREEPGPERDYQVIMHGIPETAMPASRDWLSPQGAWDLVAHLRSLTGLPPLDRGPEGGDGAGR